jgi:septum formation protein
MSQFLSPIYLASASPRRAALLKQLGIPFQLLRLREAAGRDGDVDERVLPGEKPRDYAARVANAKVSAAWTRSRQRRWPDYPVVAADTTVSLGDEIYGKPSGTEEAVAFLQALSGQTHQVHTAVCLQWREESRSVVSVSDVTFKALTDGEIAAYVATGEPHDKAGGYGIQGKAAAFISRLNGSYTGVVGLPLFETAELLASIGWRVLEGGARPRRSREG